MRQFLTSCGTGLALAAWLMAAPVPVAGQAPSAKKPATTASGSSAKAPKNWVAPKTPWGDPDIQGNLTTVNEANTPFERPDEFAGKRIQDITPQELAQLNVERQ